MIALPASVRQWLGETRARGRGHTGLGYFGSMYGKRDAGDCHGLDSVEKLADPFLPS